LDARQKQQVAQEFTGKKKSIEICLLMQWVDPGWMPGTHQSCSVTPLLSWTGQRKI